MEKHRKKKREKGVRRSMQKKMEMINLSLKGPLDYVEFYQFTQTYPFTENDITKFIAPVEVVEEFDLMNFPLNTEVGGIEIRYKGPFANKESVYFKISYINKDTGKTIYTANKTLPVPSVVGKTEYQSWKLRTWIGHASWELSGPMTLIARIEVTGDPDFASTESLEIPVIDTIKKASITSFEAKPDQVQIGDTSEITLFSESESEEEFFGGVGCSLRSADDKIIDLPLRTWKFIPGFTSIQKWQHNVLQKLPLDVRFSIWGETQAPLVNRIADTGWIPSFIREKESEPAPVSEWPDLPPDFPEEAKESFFKLKEAFVNKDKNAMLTQLRKDIITTIPVIPLITNLDQLKMVLSGAIKINWSYVLSKILSTKGILGLIVSVIGSMGFALFIMEETLQQLQFAQSNAENTGQWDIAQKVIEKQAELLSPSMENIIISFIPGVNILKALEDNFEAARYKLEVSQELNDFQLTGYRSEFLGNFTRYVEALEKGEDPSEFLPPVSLSFLFTRELKSLREIVESWYWTVKNRIDLGDKKLSEEALETFKEKINLLREWISDHWVVLDQAGIREDQVSFVEAKEADVKTFSEEIEKLELPGKIAGTLKVESNVLDSDVYINGIKKVLINKGIELLPGTYNVLVTKYGFTSHEETVEIVSGEETLFSATIEKDIPFVDEGTLNVYANVDTADVYINGIKKGITPLEIELSPGAYHILVTKFGYTSKETEVLIEKGEVELFDAVIEPKSVIDKAYISVDSEPFGFTVYLNNVVQKYRSPTIIEVDPGDYELKLKKEGYNDFIEAISLFAGETKLVSAVVSPKAEEIPIVAPEVDRWKVTVSSIPSGAKIIINGSVAARAGFTLRTPEYVILGNGSYRITVVKEGYKIPEERILTLPLGAGT